MRKPFEPSEEMLKLRALFDNIPRDYSISWDEIGSKSSVKMDIRGKELVRSALRSLDLEYLPIRGWGIRIEGVDSAMAIVGGRGKRTYNQVRKLSKSSKHHFDEYAPHLPQAERERLGLVAGLAGIMIGTAKGLAKAFSPKEVPELGGGGPSGPPPPVNWTP